MARDEFTEFNMSGASVESVLIVDSNPDSVSQIRPTLEAEGFKVSVAKDGGQAHATIQMSRPDCVILSLILPGESGFEICEWIKQKDKTVPILALTGMKLKAAKELAARVGVDAYITKPCELETLTEKIHIVADIVWTRYHQTDEDSEANTESDGRMLFACRCGKKLKVTVKKRGKSMVCPRCSQRVQIPDIYETSDGMLTWERSEDADHASDVSDALKFITIRCQHCDTYYQLFPDKDGQSRACPKCRQEQVGSLSIKGAPLSSAALANSMRVLIFRTGSLSGKKILLPNRDVYIGRSKACLIRAKSSKVADKHCLLKPTPNGLSVTDLDTESGTFVNSRKIDAETLLRPGDMLLVGALRLQLDGDERNISNQSPESVHLRDAFTPDSNSSEMKFRQANPTARDAAEVIEAHWSIVRNQALLDDPKPSD
jgi:CheY-like chemotaxis protein